MRRMRTPAVAMILGLLVLLAGGCEPTRADIEKQVVPHKLEPVASAPTGEVLGAAFGQSGSSLGCLWLERDGAQGRLRFATFDGSAWSAPVALGVVDLASATRHPLSLEGDATGWRAIWFDQGTQGSAAVLAEAPAPGKNWKVLGGFASDTAAGSGPIATADLHSPFPLVGFLGERKTTAGAAVEVAYCSHPDPKGKSVETSTFEERAAPAAGLSLLRFHDHLLMAYRKFAAADSSHPDQTMIRVEDLIHSDKSNQSFHDDGWRIPAGARGVGPLLVAVGDKADLITATQLGDTPGLAIFQGWVRPEANHEGPDPFRLIGFEVAAPMPETQRAAMRGPPQRLPTFGQASDLHAHLAADGSLVIATLEEGRPILRVVGKSGTAIERLGEGPLDPTTVLVWAGAFAGHEYLALTSGQPAKLGFFRVADQFR